MSRAYDAWRNAREEGPPPSNRRRFMVLAPVLLIVAIFAVVAVLGFGSGSGISKEQVQQEVTELVHGIPQRGAELGSPKAQITVWVYADLECPTVKLFVENYLPSFVDGWVRTGVARLSYRSLQTDTADESVFFDQEIAALAAGRQNRMWNFLLTFVRQQGEPRTNYATEEFISGIASQVPGLESAQWHRDRRDALLSKRVALGVHSGHNHGFRTTPSFFIGYSSSKKERLREAVDWASMKREVEATLQRNLNALRKEARGDFPILKTRKPTLGGS